jgi:IS605 OrfB family transposase
MKRRKRLKKIKTVKIKCLKPTNVKRDAILLTMRRARRCSNYISQIIQENKVDTFDHESKSIVNNLTYQNCHRYNIPAALIQSHRDKVIEATNSWISNGKEGHPPHWGGITAMRLDNRTLTIKREQNKWVFLVSTIKGKIPLISGSTIKDSWLNNSHSYELIWSHKHQTFFIALHVDKGKCRLPGWKDIQHILSFDINFGRIALAVSDLKGTIKRVKFFHLGRLNEKHRQKFLLRKSLQQKGGCMSLVRRLKGKEANYSRDFCHKISHKIIEIAKGVPDCLITTESLKDIRNNKSRGRKFNRCLHQMLLRLRTSVEYKARCSDIRTFLEIYPYGNSKSCSHCGSYNTSRRGRYFKCKCCGNQVDADFNAAVNCCKRALGYILKAAGQSESVPLTGRLNIATHSSIQVPISGAEFVGNDNVLLVKEQSL